MDRTLILAADVVTLLAVTCVCCCLWGSIGATHAPCWFLSVSLAGNHETWENEASHVLLIIGVGPLAPLVNAVAVGPLGESHLGCLACGRIEPANSVVASAPQRVTGHANWIFGCDSRPRSSCPPSSLIQQPLSTRTSTGKWALQPEAKDKMLAG